MGINPISKGGTTRLVRRAIDYALDRGRRSVTLVHQGNIMKYTEGVFCQWGYRLAREEEVYEKHGGKLPEGKILIKDCIADSMLQRLLLRPDEYEVLATPNLDGDYFSDACAAQGRRPGDGARGQHRGPGGPLRGHPRHPAQVHRPRWTPLRSSSPGR